MKPPKGGETPKRSTGIASASFWGKESQTRSRRKNPPRVRRVKHFCIAKILMPDGFIPPEQIKQIGWSRQGRRNPKRRTGKIKSFLSFFLVEARGVEPLSENASTGTSPGADGYLHSLTQAWAVTLRGLVASLFMVRSKLCAHTCTTRRRPIPDRGPSRLDGRVKPRRELRYRRSLIYKLPVLRWSGATARYSRLYVPVETSTPPYRRSNLRIVRYRRRAKAHSIRLSRNSCCAAPGIAGKAEPGDGSSLRGLQR